MNSFEQKLSEIAELLEPKLDEWLPKEGRLAEAMRYAVLGAGKRFRPFLVLESAKLFDVSEDSILNAAAAIECLHCYSLVHDDLPAMDDDDMRRGKPTVHKVFGEATAILVGDALQALAFEIAACEDIELVRELARAAGSVGMAGGQQLDLDTEADVERMSELKTGALIRFSVLSGAILGNASEDDRVALGTYGEQLGIAFQISDDILDAGKDAANGKNTFVTSFGLAGAKNKLEHSTNEALRALDHFGSRAAGLREAAEFMLRRTN